MQIILDLNSTRDWALASLTGISFHRVAPLLVKLFFKDSVKGLGTKSLWLRKLCSCIIEVD
jgi:hypothetical protein